MKLLIFTISVALACAGLVQSLQENNGNEVAAKNHPYLVSIRDSVKHFCSGTIISERFVLSAATCFDKQVFPTPKNQLTVRAGNEVHRIAKIIPHEVYSYDKKKRTSKNNLALIKLEDPFVFNETQQPIKLLDEEVQPDKIGVVSNWFNYGELIGTNNEQLFSAKVATIDRETCNKFYDQPNIFPKPNTILQNEICAIHKDDEGFKAVVDGSPLVINDRIVGVVSFFDWDVNPIIFSNIVYYRDWISKHAHLN